ncbi:MAG: Asp-tRNA(Asn)/Glu-tRNA(Gln) amidotransferase subunit GatB [Desulfobacterota bacterium]|nr:Asp-tRNA(Asn)/Glu-tRNA(Gln) amidotransferase subunit GatB [Thermodesulfobacteriota bacterium]
MGYEPVIGLEVHAQLLTESKIFCSCSTQFGQPPNSQTCPVCLGMPGVLPVVNKRVVEYAIKTALATNCTIQRFNQFARKNYFYPDLPKGYQISQFELPIATGGFIEIDTESGTRKIGITRIHMEEDAGKLLHEINGGAAENSFVDYNRTGIPLLEIVSEPDIHTPEEAGEYLKALRAILQYLGVCDGNMEQGSFRCDANVSLRPSGERRFGTKVELKNMNSFRHVVRALTYEITRQRELLEYGDSVIQETRLWDENAGQTLPMRGKEESHDYRYFPDPDLVPLYIEDAWIEALRSQLPELPRQRRNRFIDQYGLPLYDADILVTSRQLADYFETAVRSCNQPKTVSNWILSEVLRFLTDPRDIVSFPVTPEHLAQMICLIHNGTISGKIAKKIFEEMRTTGALPSSIVERHGLVQVSDSSKLEKVIQEILDAHPSLVADFRAGKEKVFGFLVGQIMKATKGKANPRMVNDILREKLAG